MSKSTDFTVQIVASEHVSWTIEHQQQVVAFSAQEFRSIKDCYMHLVSLSKLISEKKIDISTRTTNNSKKFLTSINLTGSRTAEAFIVPHVSYHEAEMVAVKCLRAIAAAGKQKT
jgi:hypothetical protein